MTFFALLDAQFAAVQQLELFLRIVVAAACGAVIGMERSRRAKEAGLRTHCMVACAAAVMMIISKYGFADLMNAAGTGLLGTKGADPSRIASQIVSGVSFLGVGVIYRDRKLATKGLTTAAGIWMVAGIGMAIGAGLYYIGLFTTAFVLTLQFFTHHHAYGNDKYDPVGVEIVMEDTPESAKLLRRQLDQWQAKVVESTISREKNQTIRYALVLKVQCSIDKQALARFAEEHPEVKRLRLCSDAAEPSPELC